MTEGTDGKKNVAADSEAKLATCFIIRDNRANEESGIKIGRIWWTGNTDWENKFFIFVAFEGKRFVKFDIGIFDREIVEPRRF